MNNRIVQDKKTGKILTTIPNFTVELLEEIKNYIQITDFPLVSGLAMHLGVSRNTIRNWAESIPAFTPYYEYLQTKQDSYIINGMVENKINIIAGVFLSKAILGYKDNPDLNKDTTINVTNISYKDSEKKAKKEAKEMKKLGILGTSIKEARNKQITPKTKKVGKVENEDS